MIRLLAATTDESHWKGVAARLKGVALDVSRTADAVEAYHAVLFAGREPVDEDAVKRVLQSGRHVLCAADLNWPRAQWDLLWESSRLAGVHLIVVNPERHRPSRQLIKQMLPDKLGQVGLIRMHRWESAPGPTNSAALPSPLLRDLDLALWLSGQLPDCIYALERSLEGTGAARGRFLQVHLGSPGGGMALVDYDSRLPDGDGYQSLSVIGSTGAVYADDHQNMQLVFRGGRPQAIRAEEGLKGDVHLVQSFADGLSSGQDLMQAASAWRDVLRVADAVQESLATGQAVRLEGR